MSGNEACDCGCYVTAQVEWPGKTRFSRYQVAFSASGTAFHRLNFYFVNSSFMDQGPKRHKHLDELEFPMRTHD